MAAGCSIDKSLQLELIGMVAKELDEMSKTPDNELNIEQYIKDFHKRAIDNGLSEDKAAEYTQFIPTAIRKSISLGDGSIMDLVGSTKELRKIENEFKDLAAVKEFMAPKMDIEEVNTTMESISEEQKNPKTEIPTPEVVKEETKKVLKYPYKSPTLLALTGQEAKVIKKEGQQKEVWTQQKDEEQQFYYDFYDKFSDAIADQAVDATDLTINRHTGFRLKAIRKSQIPIEVARPDEQRLVRGEELRRGVKIDADQGQRFYYGGVGVAVTDNAGEILYFDKDHNVVAKDTEGAKPIYFNIKKVDLKNGKYEVSAYDFQSTEEMAANMFVATEEIKSFDELEKKDPGLYNKLMDKADRVRQAQLELLYNIRQHLRSNKDNEVMLDITGVSRGILDIELAEDTPINSIDWAGSDVDFNITVADIENEELGESKGGLYVRVPDHRSIPIQRNNISSKDVESIIALLFDEVTEKKRGRQRAVPNSVKKNLILNYTLDSREGLQIISEKDKWKILLEGSHLPTNSLEAIETSKQKVRDFFNTKRKNSVGETTQYNIGPAQYAFRKPKAGNRIEEFEVNDGVLTTKTVTFEEHVINHATINVKPNEDNQLVFLNGYFTFNVPMPERKRLGLIEETTEIDTEDQETSKAIKPNVEFEEAAPKQTYDGLPVIETEDIVNAEGQKGAAQYDRKNNVIKVNRKLLKKKFAEKAWTKPRKLLETINGTKVESRMDPMPEDMFQTYEQFEMFVMEHERQHSKYSREQFDKDYPGLDKGAYESKINERAAFVLSLDGTLDQNINLSDINKRTYGAPQTKVDQAKKEQKKDDKGKGPLSRGRSLYRDKVLSMKSTPEQIKAAKEWYESSPLAKFVGYDEMFNVVNSNAWAEFVDGGIRLYAGADHTALYHEAWHAFSQYFLTVEEKKALYEEVAKTAAGQKALIEYAQQKKGIAAEAEITQSYWKSVIAKNKEMGKNFGKSLKLAGQTLSKVKSGKFSEITSNERKNLSQVLFNLSKAAFPIVGVGVTNVATTELLDYMQSKDFGGPKAEAAWRRLSNIIKFNSNAIKTAEAIDELTDYDKYLAVEELLAEDFRKYMLSDGKNVLKGSPKRNTIFRRILNFLKKLFSGLTMKHSHTAKTTTRVKELYDQLRVGNINQYTPSEKNHMFTDSALYKTIQPVEGETSELNEQDSMLVAESIDSIISEIIDQENTINGDSRFTSAIFTQPEIFLPDVYEEVRNRLEQKQADLVEIATQLEGIEADDAFKAASIIGDALRNWGDSSVGTIAFHLEKSPFLSSETKNIDKEVFEKTRADVDATRQFDKAGNDLSMMDLASNQVLYLVKSIKQYENGKPVQNALGFNKLADYRITWRKLANTLADKADSPREIYEALSKAAQQSPWMYDLLDKLGDVDSVHHSTFDLWTGFWAAFNLANWGLYQVSVNEITSEQEDGSFDVNHEILVGYASAVFRQVERDFRSYFKSVKDHEYIKDTGKIGNKLDYRVLDKYKGKLSTAGQKINFLRDIGFPIENTKAIREGLEDVRVDFIYNKLKKLRVRNVPITDVITALKDPYVREVQLNNGEIQRYEIKSETSNVNKILNLQARYSGLYANTAVSTADGNTKYEQTQMSTLAVMQRAINKAETFQELVDQPHMAHLHPDNNPAVAAGASIWLKSLFEYNEETGTYGKKKPNVQLKVDDLSGTQTIINEMYADLNYSTATAKSDRYTRLLQDIYSGLLGGRFSTMVHADKSTTLSMFVTEIDSGPDSTNKQLYVDFNDFLEKAGERSIAVEKAYDLLLPHLEGELIRIAKVKEGSLPAIPGYTVKDGKGNINGENLTIFDDIFINTKEEILEAGSIDNLSEDLQERMIDDLELYFSWSTMGTKKALGRMMFADPTIVDKIRQETGRSLSNQAVQDLMIEAYTMNTLLHHVESLVVMYGDLAQYNHVKEDFHKRNAAIASTGRVFRTDQDAIDFINNVIGRPFTEKQGYKAKKFDGSLDTIVLKENTVPSKMVQNEKGIEHSEYGKALYEHYRERGYSKEEAIAKTEKTLDPYLKMDEGDAQAWISFDTYRILGKLSNRWTREQEALFMQIVNNPETVQVDKIMEYFSPRKYQYFGPLQAPGVNAMAFHKYSLFPMIPTAIKGKNMEVLHDNMMSQGIDYAVFDSGSKVSTIVAEGRTQGDELYADVANREMLERDPENEDDLYTKNTIFVHYLKDQLDINSHFKKKVIFSTQLRKLVEEGLVENGVPVDFMAGDDANLRMAKWASMSESQKKKASPFYTRYKTYEDKISKFIEFRKAELREEIGSTSEELAGGKNLDKLVSFIQRELDRQDLADHEIDFIKVGEDGNLVYDLSISLSASKIERSLNAIVNNRLVRQKVNGEALVQLASTMMEPRSATDEEKARWGTNDLQTYRKDKETGKTLAMDVKVSLQGKFKHLIRLKHKDGKQIAKYTKREIETAAGETKLVKEINQAETLKRLNETIQDPEWRANQDNLDMITMVGVRIPVQGLNSMEFMAVWEFLPEEAGNVIIPPSEMVAKSGSDFDIDKLTVMMPNLGLVAGSPELIKEVENKQSNEKNLARVKELKAEIKELRAKKNQAQKEYTEKYKALGSQGLTPEEQLEKKKVDDAYFSRVREINNELQGHQFNIERLEGYEKLTNAQTALLEDSKAAIEKLEVEKEALDQDHETFKKEFGRGIYKKNLEALQESEGKRLRNILDQIAEKTRLVNGLGSEALENSMMMGIKSILEMPHNFVSLITPNDTSLLTGKGSIVEELSAYRDYKSTDGVKGDTGTMSPTRVLEPAYNIYKHESNAVGKDTLGQGAVANTYNTVLNRIGAHMNPEYKVTKGKRRATILMKHHTVEIQTGEHKGKQGISLSHMYDVKGENKVADVINQLMNGWVDVAKDAWIFDIQGNKQVTPVLDFLLESGVTLKEAIYFVSNPLIKEYVSEQKIATSAFARVKGENPSEYSFFRSKARMKILEDMGFTGHIDYDKMRPKMNKVYDTTLKMTKDLEFTEEQLQTISKKTYDEALTDFNAKAGFLHYIELEELAKGLRDIKMKLNYDTTKSTTLFDAQKKEADLEQLLMDSKFPRAVIESVLEESPIGSFRVAPFQLELWGPLFEIRNHPAINNFFVDKLSNMSAVNKMKKVYGTEERYIEEFKNDFMVKMFTDVIKSFDLSDQTYNGVTIERGQQVKQVDMIDRGVAVLPNEDGELVLYMDTETLDLQFENALYTGTKVANSPMLQQAANKFNYETLGLATVPMAAFTYGYSSRKSEFYRFVMEREILRAQNPFNEMSKTHYFQYRAKGNMAKLQRLGGETVDAHEKRVLRTTYEEILRDTALDNILNYWKLFMSDNTAADQLFEMKSMHPTLNNDFNIINDLIISEGSKSDRRSADKAKGKSFTNLSLRDNRAPKDALDIYYQNMLYLSDDGTNKIPIYEDTAEIDYIENDRITEFFKRLPFVAFLQSGLNATDALSMVRVMPTDRIAEIIQSKYDETKSALDSYNAGLAEYIEMGERRDFRGILDRFYAQFNSHNSPSNISIRRRLKNYVSDENADFGLTQMEEDAEGDLTDNPNKILTVPATSKASLQELIKNNPNVTFVLEAAQDPNATGYWVDGIGKVDKLDNVVPIITRKSVAKGTKGLWTRATKEENMKFVQESLDRLQEVVEGSDNKVAFVRQGYGTYMIDRVKEGSAEMRDKDTYEFLTTELYNRFGYKNPFSKVVDDVQEMMETNQELEYQIDISDEDYAEAAQRLTCK